LDDFKPGSGFLFDLLRGLRKVLLEKLHVNIERTERVANFMRNPGQQAREEMLFLPGRHFADIFAERTGEDFFHEGKVPLKAGRHQNGEGSRCWVLKGALQTAISQWTEAKWQLTLTRRSIMLSASVDIFSGLIESGGGTGPKKPRQPTQGASLSDQVPNPAQETEINEKTRTFYRPLLNSVGRGFLFPSR
jgi:hypothetical protein